MSDRTPAEALASARWDRELDPDHPWYVAWDDVSPRLRREQVEFAEADIELLAAAGFRVSSKPDDDTRREVERIIGHLRDDLPGWLDTIDHFIDLAADSGSELAQRYIAEEGPASERDEMQRDMRTIADPLERFVLGEVRSDG